MISYIHLIFLLYRQSCLRCFLYIKPLQNSQHLHPMLIFYNLLQPILPHQKYNGSALIKHPTGTALPYEKTTDAFTENQ